MTKQQAAEASNHGFRRMVSVARVGEAGLAQSVEAKAAEREKIARYLGLPALAALTAEVTLTPWRGKGVRVQGTLRADVTQACVVTLDPVHGHVEASFERRFLPPEMLGRDESEQREVFVDPEGEDPAEPLDRDIDLGEILVEELSLNLDPYPRKPGIEFHSDEAGAPRETPFATLAKLKARLEEK
jgi:uncharacterized metal-binding protein YceD (DUF177 family)